MAIRLQFDSVQLERGRRGVDFRQLKRMMARSHEVESYMRQRLSEAAAYAQHISPDADPVGQGYKFSWVVEIAQFPDGVPVGRLTNSDPKWVWVEYGAGPQDHPPRPQGGYFPAQHVMSRTFWHMVFTR
jgi:hypothetical protein